MKFNFISILVLFVALNSAPVLGAEYIPLNPKKMHLDFYLEKGPFHLEFFKSKNFKGKPKIELNEKGLFIGGKQVCAWPNNQFDSKNPANMVLVQEKSKSPCRDVPFIRSTWGDGGTGTAVLTIEVFKLKEDIAIISYGSSQLFISVKNFKEKFNRRPPGELSNTIGD